MGTPNSLDDLESRVLSLIELEVRPSLQTLGGDVELVGVDDDRVVQVRLLGACQGCGSASYVTVMEIESTLKLHLPEIRFVEAVL